MKLLVLILLITQFSYSQEDTLVIHLVNSENSNFSDSIYGKILIYNNDSDELNYVKLIKGDTLHTYSIQYDKNHLLSLSKDSYSLRVKIEINFYYSQYVIFECSKLPEEITVSVVAIPSEILKKVTKKKKCFKKRR